MERKPSRMMLAGGVFLLAIGIFAACFLSPQGSRSRQAAIVTPTRPAVLAAATLLPPGPPPVAKSIQVPAGTVPDPFAGGPAPQRPKPVKIVTPTPPPSMVVYVMPVPYPYQPGGCVFPPRDIIPIDAAPFRYVGILINNGNEQITAIVENRAGQSRVVRVGDAVDGWHIRGIARDGLTLDDGHGRRWSMEFAGTGDYQYRTRWEPRE
ncbi:MAG: hypothetical protein ACYC6A_15470 [Armatimonadota bacterium]